MSARERPHTDPGRRSSRLAAALGVAVGCGLIWGSLAALNHSVLGFHAWPTPDRSQAARLVIPDAPSLHRAGGSAAVRLALRGGNVVPAGTLVPGAGGRTVTIGSPQAPGSTNRSTTRTRPGARVGVPGGVLGPGGSRRPGTTGPTPTGPTTGTPVAVAPALVDTDRDGLPDVYETAHGLNPTDPADGAADSNGDGVTKAEEYRRLATTEQSASKGKGTVPVDTPIDAPVETPVVTPPADPAPAPDPTPAPDPQATPTPAAPTEPVTPVDPPPAEPAPATDPPVADPQVGGVEAPAEPAVPVAAAPVVAADAAAAPAPAA